MLAAAASYGFAANYTRKRLSGVAPLVNAAGSQLASALALAPFAIALRPAALPGRLAWAAVAVLGIACTAAAYILYFRLIAHVGAARAVTVTYLIPLFGTLWGARFLGEQVTGRMLVGGAVILLGTALATGAIGRRAAAPEVAAPVVTLD
jgi:drug/metabolite transporter (DMT)-like permease